MKTLAGPGKKFRDIGLVIVAALVMFGRESAYADISSISPVSADSSGILGNGNSSSPLISNLTGIVVFRTEASNLVPGNLDGSADILAASGNSLARINSRADGSEMEGAMRGPLAISGDGSTVAFLGSAGALEASPSSLRVTCEETSVYLHNRTTGETRELLLAKDAASPDGFTYPTGLDMSGRLLLLVSSARNIADPPLSGTNLLLYDSESGTIQLLAKLTDELLWEEELFHASMSADGRFVAFDACEAEENAVENTGQVGAKCNCRTEVLMLDRSSGEVKRVSANASGDPADESAHSPAISADGSTIAFVSASKNLLPGSPELKSLSWDSPAQIYMYHRVADQLELASVTAAGEPANGECGAPQLSATGKYLVFESAASNLRPEQSPQAECVNEHAYYRGADGAILPLEHAPGSTSDFDTTFSPVISGSGLQVAFVGRPKPNEDQPDPHDQVYLAALDAVPDDLTLQEQSMGGLMRRINAIVRSSKPYVTVRGRQVRISVQGFSRLGIRSRLRNGMRLAATSAKRITSAYELTILTPNSKALTIDSRRTGLRAILPAGVYKASYRVVLRQGGREIAATSRSSAVRKFSVR